jgi:hypothetical protein
VIVKSKKLKKKLWKDGMRGGRREMRQRVKGVSGSGLKRRQESSFRFRDVGIRQRVRVCFLAACKPSRREGRSSAQNIRRFRVRRS